jgi:large subunit ribosomal protein L3
MGFEQVTIQNLEVVAVDLENNVILIKGSVPGPKKSLVMIKTSVKNGDTVNDAEELITYEVIEEAAEPTETPVEETTEEPQEETEEVVEEPTEETTEETA